MKNASIFDYIGIPPSAQHLGFTLIDVDADQGVIIIQFTARPEFVNPVGFIQGGYIAAMLDETMGPALVAHTNGTYFPTTINMSINYFAPAKPGVFKSHGRVIKLGKTVAFLEAHLEDEDGILIAQASASARLFKHCPPAHPV